MQRRTDAAGLWTLGIEMKKAILILAAVLMLTGWALTQGFFLEASEIHSAIHRIIGLLVFMPGGILMCVGIFWGYRYKGQMEFITDVLKSWRAYVPIAAAQLIGSGIGYAFLQSDDSARKLEAGATLFTVVGFVIGLVWYLTSPRNARIRDRFPVLWFLGTLSIMALLTGLATLRTLSTGT